jgi:hypothetical protein
VVLHSHHHTDFRALAERHRRQPTHRIDIPIDQPVIEQAWQGHIEGNLGNFHLNGVLQVIPDILP